MFFLFGLGNPGRRYKYTLHNLGFWTLDEFGGKYKVSFRKKICNSRIAHLCFNPQDSKITREVYLIKPYTYMNLSGKAVFCLKNEYKFNENQILIICDDFNLGRGYVRIKPEGSAGGHKGLDSIIDVLGTEKFPRLRIGVGPLKDEIKAEDYVLKALDKEMRREYKRIVEKVVEIIEFYLLEGLEKTMSFYNRKKII